MFKKTITTILLGTVLLSSVIIIADQPTVTPVPKPAATSTTAPSQPDLDKKFADLMSNGKMSGSFTMNGSDKIGHDEYSLGEVKKADGDNWQITANIKYGKHDVSLPLVVPVKWAGDTPVISVTDFGFPGLGKYTARVLFYGDEYVGIWSSSDGSHGGKMWGKVEKAKKE